MVIPHSLAEQALLDFIDTDQAATLGDLESLIPSLRGHSGTLAHATALDTWTS